MPFALSFNEVVTYSGVGGGNPRVCSWIHWVVSGQAKVLLGFCCLLIKTLC